MIKIKYNFKKINRYCCCNEYSIVFSCILCIFYVVLD